MNICIHVCMCDRERSTYSFAHGYDNLDVFRIGEKRLTVHLDKVV